MKNKSVLQYQCCSAEKFAGSSVALILFLPIGPIPLSCTLSLTVLMVVVDFRILQPCTELG